MEDKISLYYKRKYKIIKIEKLYIIFKRKIRKDIFCIIKL